LANPIDTHSHSPQYIESLKIFEFLEIREFKLPVVVQNKRKTDSARRPKVVELVETQPDKAVLK
jgi:hypothetical protein